MKLCVLAWWIFYCIDNILVNSPERVQDCLNEFNELNRESVYNILWGYQEFRDQFPTIALANLAWHSPGVEI